MMIMHLALALMSVVALSIAAPQNYTPYLHIAQASATDPSPSPTTTFNYADGATRITGGATRASTGASNAMDKMIEVTVGVTAPDVSSEKVESTTTVVLGTTTEEEDDESSTDSPYRTGGGVQTTTWSAVRGDKPEDQGNATKIGSSELEEPEYGFNFKLPSFFTTISPTVPRMGSSGSNSTSSETSPDVHGSDDSDVISNSQVSNRGLVIDSTPPPTIFNTTSTTLTASPVVTVSPIPSRHNVLSTSDFDNQIPFIPSASFDASSSSGHNLLSTSDFNNQHAPLRPEHLARMKKSLTESKLNSNHGAITPSIAHQNPDYFVPPSTVVGNYNSNEYNNDYYFQSFSRVGTPEVNEAGTSHSGNNGRYPGQFQYNIRTSSHPGVLATFPASASSSTVHSSSPAIYSSQGVFSTGSQSGVGHVSLASQPPSHVTLIPNFQTSSNINFASKPQPSFGFGNSLRGSFLLGHQQTKADSASATSRPDGPSYSKTTVSSSAFHDEHQQTNADSSSGTDKPDKTFHSTSTTGTSNAFHAGHQQTKAASASGSHSPDETYYSTPTERSLSSKGTSQILSTRRSDSSNNVTRFSNKTTEFPLFDSSEVTTTSTVGVEDTTDQKVGKGKPVIKF